MWPHEILKTHFYYLNTVREVTMRYTSLCHMEIYGTNLEVKVDLSNEQTNSNNNNKFCNTSTTINTFTLLLTIIIK